MSPGGHNSLSFHLCLTRRIFTSKKRRLRLRCNLFPEHEGMPHTGARTLSHTHSPLAKTRRFTGSRHLRKSLLNQIATKLTKQRLQCPPTTKNTGFTGLAIAMIINPREVGVSGFQSCPLILLKFSNFQHKLWDMQGEKKVWPMGGKAVNRNDT